MNLSDSAIMGHVVSTIREYGRLEQAFEASVRGFCEQRQAHLEAQGGREAFPGLSNLNPFGWCYFDGFAEDALGTEGHIAFRMVDKHDSSWVEVSVPFAYFEAHGDERARIAYEQAQTIIDGHMERTAARQAEKDAKDRAEYERLRERFEA